MAEQTTRLPVIQKFVAILWPAFITAGLATILFFTAFDPQFVFMEYDISRLGAYSIGFFLFWLFGVITSTLTCYYMRPCDTLNRPGRSANARDNN